MMQADGKRPENYSKGTLAKVGVVVCCGCFRSTCSPWQFQQKYGKGHGPDPSGGTVLSNSVYVDTCYWQAAGWPQVHGSCCFCLLALHVFRLFLLWRVRVAPPCMCQTPQLAEAPCTPLLLLLPS
jgi:hypothetical protein